VRAHYAALVFRMSLKRTIQGLGPYPALLLLGLPAAVVEPLKLVAVALAGKGHWVSGTVMIAVCYAVSLLVVERLFVIVKPKLLTIPWFAKVWEAFVSVRRRTWRILGGWIGLLAHRKHPAPTSRAERADRAKPVVDQRSAGR
jgi:hypothetical protein